MKNNNIKNKQKSQAKIPINASIETIREFLGEEEKCNKKITENRNQMNIQNYIPTETKKLTYQEKKEIAKSKSIKDIVEKNLGLPLKKYAGTLRPKTCPICSHAPKKNAPSFAIRQIQNQEMFKTFCCKKSGDVIEFIKHARNINYRDAVNYLVGDHIKITPKVTPKKEQKEQKSGKTFSEILEFLKPASAKKISELLERREFGKLKSIGTKILRNKNTKFSKLKNNEIFLDEPESFVFEIKNNKQKNVAYQKIGNLKNKKKNKGEVSKGYWVANPIKETQQEIILCESILDSLALACIGYTSVCLIGKSVRKIKMIKAKFPNRELYLWLDSGEEEQKITKEAIQEHKVKGIFWHKKKQGYDVGDLLREEHDNFEKIVHQYVKNSANLHEPQESTHIKFVERKKEYFRISEVVNPIRNLQEKNIFMFSAPTGVGKSHLIVDQSILLALQGKPVTIITNSISNVDNIISEIHEACKKQKIQNVSVSRNVSAKKSLGEEISYKKDEMGLIAVTTYYYLGRQGQTPKTYKIADTLTKNRTLFCDEIQCLVKDICNINIPLAARYRQIIKTHKKIKKCFKDCSKCHIAYLRKDMNKNKEHNFYGSFDKSSLEKHANPERAYNLFTKKTFDVSKFTNHEGIFSLPIKETLDYQIPPENFIGDDHDLDEFEQYIIHLGKTLKHPQVSANSPTWKEDGSCATPEQIRKVDEKDRKDVFNFPVNACHIPHLKGFDILPFLQLLQAEKIIICSATIPKLTHDIIDEILKHKQDWKISKKEVNEVPIKFHGTVFTTKKSISLSTLQKILEQLKHPSICVPKTIADSKELFDAVSGEHIEIFTDGHYSEKPKYSRFSRESGRKRHLLAHLRCTLLAGINFFDKTVMIIDCNSFFPHILFTQNTKEERIKEMVKQLQTMVIQAMGRLLRSRIKRDPHRTVEDPRSIVFILHGLNYDIEIDTSLFSYLQVYDEIFMTKSKPHQSILFAIEEAVQKKQVTNYKSQEKAEDIRAAVSKGLRNITPKRRQNIDKNQLSNVRSRNKTEKKVFDLIKKAKLFTGTWRSFYQKFNVGRLDKRSIREIKHAFVLK